MTGMPWWGDITLAAAALLIALGTIYRYIRPAAIATWRFLRGIYQLIEDFRDTGGFAGLAAQNSQLAGEVVAIKRELHPNGGTSLRDSVTRCETGLGRLHQQVSAVTDQATAISQRQEFLRAADETTAADLRRFLEGDWRETQEANQHLRSAVNELLAVESEERHGDDR